MKVVRTVLLTMSLAAFAMSAAHAADNGRTDMVVDFAKSTGKIRALHGVNNGPVIWSLAADLTNYHKEAGFPSARLHDCLYSGQDVADVHCIFPVFDADADDPKHYTFAKTDAYIAAIIKSAATPSSAISFPRNDN